jgi:hypothetical protein
MKIYIEGQNGFFQQTEMNTDELGKYVTTALRNQCVEQHIKKNGGKWTHGNMVSFRLPEDESDPFTAYYSDGAVYDYYSIDEGAKGMRVVEKN